MKKMACAYYRQYIRLITIITKRSLGYTVVIAGDFATKMVFNIWAELILSIDKAVLLTCKVTSRIVLIEKVFSRLLWNDAELLKRRNESFIASIYLISIFFFCSQVKKVVETHCISCAMITQNFKCFCTKSMNTQKSKLYSYVNIRTVARDLSKNRTCIPTNKTF